MRKRLWKMYGKGQWRKLKGIAKVEFADGTMCEAEIHWYEAHGIGAKDTKSNESSRSVKREEARFALCVENRGYPASLERRKVYRLLADDAASKHRQVRVIDESGEDYLYPQEYFVPIKLPQAAERAVLKAN